MGITEIINSIAGLFITVLHSIRELITKISVGYQLIIFLVLSLILGFLFIKRFVTTPFRKQYIIWYLLLSLIFFILLAYL